MSFADQPLDKHAGSMQSTSCNHVHVFSAVGSAVVDARALLANGCCCQGTGHAAFDALASPWTSTI
eukprot:365983-Chlamydomonas_euryale.AAC.6